MLNKEALEVIELNKPERPLPKKKGCGRSLTEGVIKRVIDDLYKGLSQREVARSNGISATTVNRIAKRLRG